MEAVASLLVPSGMAYALFLAGLLASVPKVTRAFSWWLLAASGVIALVFSSGMVAAAIMSPLEYSNAGLRDVHAHPDSRHIVVLTGWASDDPKMPLSGRLSTSSLYRVVYAFELWTECPQCDVVVSGGEVAARIMGDMLRDLGVPTERIRVDDESGSTAASAAALRTMVGTEPFLLVTSAGHMPRALGLMRRQELTVIPAPTDYQLPKDWWYAEAKPSSYSLWVSDLAVREYLAIAWYRLRGLM